MNALPWARPSRSSARRPLHGEQRELVRDVAHVGAAQLAALQRLEGGLAVRGVDDEQVAVLVEPVDDQVVDDPARLGGQQRVLRLTGVQAIDVVRERALQEVVARSGPRPRSRPCARRRRRPRRCARPGARGSRPRTGRASPSRRTARCRAPSATWRSKSGVRRSVCIEAMLARRLRDTPPDMSVENKPSTATRPARAGPRDPKHRSNRPVAMSPAVDETFRCLTPDGADRGCVVRGRFVTA